MTFSPAQTWCGTGLAGEYCSPIPDGRKFWYARSSDENHSRYLMFDCDSGTETVLEIEGDRRSGFAGWTGENELYLQSGDRQEFYFFKFK